MVSYYIGLLWGFCFKFEFKMEKQSNVIDIDRRWKEKWMFRFGDVMLLHLLKESWKSSGVHVSREPDWARES